MSRHPKPIDDEYSAYDLEQEEKLTRRRRSEQKKTEKPVKPPRKQKRPKHGDKP